MLYLPKGTATIFPIPNVPLQCGFVTLPSGGVCVLSSWTWVDLCDDLGQENSEEMVLCGFWDWTIKMPWSFLGLSRFLGCFSLSWDAHSKNPAVMLRGSPKECHGERPHGEVPDNSPAGVQRDSKYQQPVMWRKCLQMRGQQRLPVKGWIINIFGFEGHTVSVAPT